MRCKNCGWNNPDTAERCEKCNRPLVTSTVSSYNPAPMPSNYAAPGQAATPNNKATRFDANLINNTPAAAAPMMSQPSAAPAPVTPQSGMPNKVDDNRATRLYAAPQAAGSEEELPSNCPSCGYPLSPGSTVCPMCGTSLVSNSGKPAYEATLTCMDDDSHTSITISASKQLTLQSGEIVLIGGLRYKVD